MKDLTFPRYLYNELGDAVLVAEPKDAYGLLLFYQSPISVAFTITSVLIFCRFSF